MGFYNKFIKASTLKVTPETMYLKENQCYEFNEMGNPL